MKKTAELRLVTLHGPEDLSLDLVPPGPMTMGRRVGHNLVLSEGATVSRDHAVLVRHVAHEEGVWTLTDSGSRHGTFLNGVRLEPGRGVPLQGGDLLVIEPFAFQVVDPAADDHRFTHTLDDGAGQSGTNIQQVHHTAGVGLAQERLAALLACSRAIHLAENEESMANSLAEAAMAGTAFANAAIVKPVGSDGKVKVLAVTGDITKDGPGTLNISRSLLGAAMEGEPVRFHRVGGVVDDQQQQSILQYSIEEAICVPIMLGHAVSGCIYLDSRDGQVRLHTVEEDVEYCAGLAQIAALAMSNLMRVEIERRHARERQDMLLSTVAALVAAIDAKDTYTRGHSERVAWLARELGRAAALDVDTVEQLHMCGLVHDIGKIGIPESILQKPSKLTDEEFDQIRRHPAIGESILGGVAQLQAVLPGVRSHHERWDGRGYPDGHVGDATPFFGRLLAIADAFDAMCSSRAYRDGLDRKGVMQEMEECSGTQFDPELIPPFLKIDFGQYDDMIARHTAQDPAC